MNTALWLIAICQAVRLVQNTIQLGMLIKEKDVRHNAYEEFVKSLREPEKEFVERLLREFEDDLK